MPERGVVGATSCWHLSKLMSTHPKARAWVDVHGSALLSNYRRLSAAVGSGVGVLPMVKADAYGIGMAAVVDALLPERPWGFGVATVDEGLSLRGRGFAGRVVVCSPPPPDAIVAAVESGLEVSVGSLDAVAAVARAAECVDRVGLVHLDVDTGMGRSGMDWRRLDDALPAFRAALGPRVRWTGLFTHLHSAESDPEANRVQVDRFGGWVRAAGPDRPGLVCHVLNSAGVFRMPDASWDLVRPGIFLFGGGCGGDVPAPEPVVAVRARVVHVREVVPGTTVGYGATHTAEAGERWATLAIGYGDGLPRSLGNRGSALLRGREVPIVGRISMDVTVVNITGVDGVGVGDVATLVGRDGDRELSLDGVAARAGTISYEILTGLSPRLPRVWEWVDGG